MNFEDYLREVLAGFKPSLTKEAMRYSLLAGGKRTRPELLFAALKGYGIDPEIGYPAAAAVEMIHTYSLIHDDLPAMDNDDFRRGRPSAHKAFKESTAILAGDALLTEAFAAVLKTQAEPEVLADMVGEISLRAGANGMIYGQDLDLKAEDDNDFTLKKLIAIDKYKTGQLIILPLVLAAMIAKKEEDIPALEQIGLACGIQFQVQDDILDVTKSAEELGKSNSDEENGKATAVTLLGLDKAQKMVEDYGQLIDDNLDSLHMDTVYLREIFHKLLHREK